MKCVPVSSDQLLLAPFVIYYITFISYSSFSCELITVFIFIVKLPQMHRSRHSAGPESVEALPALTTRCRAELSPTVTQLSAQQRKRRQTDTAPSTKVSEQRPSLKTQNETTTRQNVGGFLPLINLVN